MYIYIYITHIGMIMYAAAEIAWLSCSAWLFKRKPC